MTVQSSIGLWPTPSVGESLPSSALIMSVMMRILTVGVLRLLSIHESNRPR